MPPVPGADIDWASIERAGTDLCARSSPRRRRHLRFGVVVLCGGMVGGALCDVEALTPVDSKPKVSADEDPLELTRRTIERVARQFDGQATDRGAALLDALRGALSRTVALAERDDGEITRKARDLLQASLLHKDGNVSMQASLAILSRRWEDGTRWLLEVFPDIPVVGVRLRVLDWLAVQGAVSGRSAALRRALTVERSARCRAKLIEVLAKVGGVENAAAMLAALRPTSRDATKPPPTSEGGGVPRRAGGEGAGLGEGAFGSIELEARRQSIAAWTRTRDPAIVEWLSGAAFTAAASEGDTQTRQVQFLALLEVVRARRLRAARPHVRSLLTSSTADIGVAAVEALESFSPIARNPDTRAPAGGTEAGGIPASSERVELLGVLRGNTLPAATAARLARCFATRPPVDMEPLLALSESSSWLYRREAALQLGWLSESEESLDRLLRLIERDPNREVRLAGYEVLRRFRFKRAVPFVIALLTPLKGRDPGAALAYLRWASARPRASRTEAWSEWWEKVEPTFEFPNRESVRSEDE